VHVRVCDKNSANINEGAKKEIVELLAACSKYERK
jgi:hypothetical protein